MKYAFLLSFLLCVPRMHGQTYFLNGDASFLGDDCYRLTTTLNFQNGTVWYGDQIDLNEPFDISFLMNLGNIDANGADGICFVLQTVGTGAIGESGGGLGYLNFGTSLGIEFDTWQNTEYGDPWEDHIAIERDGDINHNSANNIAGPVQMDPFDANTEDGQDHTVRITWNPVEQSLSVYFDCYFRLQGEVDLINDVFSGQNLVYWGFTAATGGSYNDQTVCLQENILSVGEEVTICPGASAQLSAGSSLDGVYTWNPADFLDDPASPTPIATPPSTTTYTVTFTDLCGDAVEAQITVLVEELEVVASGDGSITCANPSVVISSSANFNGLTYGWNTVDGSIVSGQGSASITVDAGGSYTLIADYQGQCSDELLVIIPEDLDVPEADAGEPAVITCAEPVATLSGSTDTPDFTAEWTTAGGTIIDGEDSLSPDVSEAGTYTLTITDQSSGCTQSDVVVVTNDFAAPVITIGAQDTLSCFSPQVTIANVTAITTGPIEWSWSTEDGSIVNGSFTSNPVVDAPGLYLVTATNPDNGCSFFSEVEIIADEAITIDLSTLEFPNVITPNGDGRNSPWRPFLRNDPQHDISPLFTTWELRVFNRWGSLVFESDQASIQWRGTEEDEGVYYYTLRYAAECGLITSGTREGYVHVFR